MTDLLPIFVLLLAVTQLVLISSIVAVQRRVLRALQAQGARSPQTAVRFQPANRNEASALRTLLHRRLVRESGSGAFYVDEAALQASLARQKSLTRWLAVVAVVLAVIMAGLLVWMRSRG